MGKLPVRLSRNEQASRDMPLRHAPLVFSVLSSAPCLQADTTRITIGAEADKIHRRRARMPLMELPRVR